tara:strand:+ start:792 stop:1778 length:987 start_codon:yes stop_codon:yes gene_type:complete
MEILRNIILSDNKNFRKRDKRTNKYFSLVEKEHKLFEKKFRNKSKIVSSALFINKKNCSVCNSNNYKNFIIKFGFQYVKCSNCSHIYLRNQIKKKILLDLYSKSKTDRVSRERKKFSDLDIYWQNLYFKYSNIINTLKPKGKFLDIGCGDGAFLKFMKNNFNYELFGTEFSSDTKMKLKKLLGKNFFYQKEIEDLKIPNSYFDIISLIGVLEHLSDPGKMFKSLNKYLKKDGIIFILIPNIESYAFSILKDKTPALNPRAHLNFFNPKSLEKIAKKNNFKIINQYQELPVIDLVHEKRKVNDLILKKIIKENKCYYHLYLLRKRTNKI